MVTEGEALCCKPTRHVSRRYQSPITAGVCIANMEYKRGHQDLARAKLEPIELVVLITTQKMIPRGDSF